MRQLTIFCLTSNNLIYKLKASLSFSELIKDWESLRVKLVKLSHTDSEQKPKNADLEAATIDVHRSLAALEEKLSSITLSITNAGAPAQSLDQLKNNIKTLQVNDIDVLVNICVVLNNWIVSWNFTELKKLNFMPSKDTISKIMTLVEKFEIV